MVARSYGSTDKAGYTTASDPLLSSAIPPLAGGVHIPVLGGVGELNLYNSIKSWNDACTVKVGYEPMLL
jgi:hypothetical protein